MKLVILEIAVIEPLNVSLNFDIDSLRLGLAIWFDWYSTLYSHNNDIVVVFFVIIVAVFFVVIFA